MSALANLKLTAAKKSTNISPVMQRRNKVALRINQQIQLATAQQEGKSYSPTKQKTVTDAETGESKVVQVPKRIKEWWFTADNGKLCLSLKYGSKTVELMKGGKTAIELLAEKDLLPALTTLRNAVLGGELDAQLEAVSGAVKAGFKK